jgi:transposase-like protein
MNNITEQQLQEMQDAKKAFESAIKAYQSVLNGIKSRPTKKTNIKYTNYFDYFGFTKKELEFINFLIIEKLRNATNEEKKLIIPLNNKVIQKINSKPSCQKCGSEDVILIGTRKNKKNYVQKFACRNCKTKFSFGKKRSNLMIAAEIIKLNKQGFGSRTILKKLGNTDIENHSTISRFLKEVRQ